MAKDALSENIKRLMKERGWSQMDLVRSSGLDQGRLSHILSGNNTQLRLPTILRLAGAFGVPVDRLVSPAKANSDGVLDIMRVDPENKQALSSEPFCQTGQSYQIDFSNSILMEVETSEMTPSILKGSRILLSRNTKITSGRIYLIVLKSSKGILLRRIEDSDGKFLLKADNPEFRTVVIRKSQITKIFRVEAILF